MCLNLGAHFFRTHPKKGQKFYYSGKKKQHTLKAQVVADERGSLIMCTNMCNSKQHDFNRFKESRLQFLPTIKVFADSGYQGINKLHKNTEIPKKKTKKTSLSSQDKRNNLDISRTKIKNLYKYHMYIFVDGL